MKLEKENESSDTRKVGRNKGSRKEIFAKKLTLNLNSVKSSPLITMKANLAALQDVAWQDLTLPEILNPSRGEFNYR